MAVRLEVQACRHGLVRPVIRAILVEAQAGHRGDLDRQEATVGAVRRRGLVVRTSRRGKAELQDRLLTIIISHRRHRRGPLRSDRAASIRPG